MIEHFFRFTGPNPAGVMTQELSPNKRLSTATSSFKNPVSVMMLVVLVVVVVLVVLVVVVVELVDAAAAAAAAVGPCSQVIIQKSKNQMLYLIGG